MGASTTAIVAACAAAAPAPASVCQPFAHLCLHLPTPVHIQPSTSPAHLSLCSFALTRTRSCLPLLPTLVHTHPSTPPARLCLRSFVHTHPHSFAFAPSFVPTHHRSHPHSLALIPTTWSHLFDLHAVHTCSRPFVPAHLYSFARLGLSPLPSHAHWAFV